MEVCEFVTSLVEVCHCTNLEKTKNKQTSETGVILILRRICKWKCLLVIKENYLLLSQYILLSIKRSVKLSTIYGPNSIIQPSLLEVELPNGSYLLCKAKSLHFHTMNIHGVALSSYSFLMH